MITPEHLKPLRNLILLDTTPIEDTTDSGIIITASLVAKATTKYGTIIALGPLANDPGIHLDAKGKAHYFGAGLDLKPGMRVCVAKYARDHINHEGRRYHFAEATQVMAIIKEPIYPGS